MDNDLDFADLLRIARLCNGAGGEDGHDYWTDLACECADGTMGRLIDMAGRSLTGEDAIKWELYKFNEAKKRADAERRERERQAAVDAERTVRRLAIESLTAEQRASLKL